MAGLHRQRRCELAGTCRDERNWTSTSSRDFADSPVVDTRRRCDHVSPISALDSSEGPARNCSKSLPRRAGAIRPTARRRTIRPHVSRSKACCPLDRGATWDLLSLGDVSGGDRHLSVPKRVRRQLRGLRVDERGLVGDDLSLASRSASQRRRGARRRCTACRSSRGTCFRARSKIADRSSLSKDGLGRTAGLSRTFSGTLGAAVSRSVHLRRAPDYQQASSGSAPGEPGRVLRSSFW